MEKKILLHKLHRRRADAWLFLYSRFCWASAPFLHIDLLHAQTAKHARFRKQPAEFLLSRTPLHPQALKVKRFVPERRENWNPSLPVGVFPNYPPLAAGNPHSGCGLERITDGVWVSCWMWDGIENLLCKQLDAFWVFGRRHKTGYEFKLSR